MRPIRLVLSLAVVIGLMCGASVPATLRAAEGTGSAQYFEATGHKVEGSFLNFWQRNGGLAIFGYPIPSTFQQDGRQTQYFERAVFQSFPELSADYAVQLMLLGRILSAERESEAAFQPEARPAATNAVTYFPQTHHSVRRVFRSYWNNNGGLAVFGYPISSKFDERGSDGRTYRVQYFERARFEYHPEMPARAMKCCSDSSARNTPRCVACRQM